ncbi:MAG: small multi-drug export protein [Thermoplasmatales archaeon]|nr:small multi-drug export protein [Thermoplasmatales archaeon]
MDEIIKWLIVIGASLSPFSELRGAIPLAFYYKLNLFFAIPLILFANFLPSPLIIKFLYPVERWLRKWNFWNKFFEKMYKYTRRKTEKSIERWETLALIIFVAIPLPFTGAWTGSLASYLFGLNFRKSLICIFTGICIACMIVTLLTFAGVKIFG